VFQGIVVNCYPTVSDMQRCGAAILLLLAVACIAGKDTVANFFISDAAAAFVDFLCYVCVPETWHRQLICSLFFSRS
jgi:hypothetical protein